MNAQNCSILQKQTEKHPEGKKVSRTKKQN
jgi:hypothetical protein